MNPTTKIKELNIIKYNQVFMKKNLKNYQIT